ncbi:MAG: hypothetical protein ACKERG_00125 [Candidatus Hodgkinia cicadicola]
MVGDGDKPRPVAMAAALHLHLEQLNVRNRPLDMLWPLPLFERHTLIALFSKRIEVAECMLILPSLHNNFFLIFCPLFFSLSQFAKASKANADWQLVGVSFSRVLATLKYIEGAGLRRDGWTGCSACSTNGGLESLGLRWSSRRRLVCVHSVM